MESSTKMIQLTGGATKKGRATRRKEQKGQKRQKGGSLQSDLIVSKFPDAMAPAAAAAAAADCSIKGYQSPTLVHGAPLSIAYKPVMPQVPESAVAVAASYPAFPQGQPAQTTTQSGAGKPSKVVLQSKSKTVHLAPKGTVATVATAVAATVAASAKKAHATKRARRITLGLQALKKRQTRAHKIHADVKDMPIAKVREHLIAKKIIKPTSKAPEKVLRQIATDVQIVAGKGL